MRMKKMNKSTVAAFGIAMGLVVAAVGMLIGVWVGCSPILLAGQGAETADAGLPAVVGEVTAAGEDAVITLYPFGKDAASRSVTGPYAGVIQGGGSNGLINYIQFIVMEDTPGENGAIAAFAEMEAGAEGGISVTVSTGKKYHLLYLWGHKNSQSDREPTLLVSAYGWVEVKPGTNPVTMPLVPLVVDMVFYKVGEETIPLTYTTGGSPIAATSGSQYQAEVTLGAKQIGADAVGDGLWPLKLADPGLRRSDIHARNKGAAFGSFELGISAGGYYGGNAVEDVTVNAAMAAATVTLTENAGYSENNSSPGSLSTGNTASYTFTPTIPGKFYFTMKYTPFAVTPLEWNSKTNTAPTWVIRSGLNDEAQNADTDFAAAAASGNNGNGAIPVAVTLQAANAYLADSLGNALTAPATISATKASNLGTGGAASADTLTIALGKATVRESFTNMDAAGWMRPAVPGLTYLATAISQRRTIDITVGGIPTETSSATGVKIVLPPGILNDENHDLITGTLTVAGTVTYDIRTDVPDAAATLAMPATITATKANTQDRGGEGAKTTLTINLTHAKVHSIAGQSNAGIWGITPIVPGLYYTVTATSGDRYIKIAVTGLPLAVSTADNVVIPLPAGILKDDNGRVSTVPLTVSNMAAYNIGTIADAIIYSPPTITATKANADGGGGVAAATNFNITLSDATVAAALNGSVSDWVSATVPGLVYRATAGSSASNINIAVTGIPTAVSSANMVVITLPPNTLKDASGALINEELTVTGYLTYNIGKAPEGVTGVSLNKASTTIFVGATEQLMETVTPADAANKGVTWSSSNGAAAYVSTIGKVTGLAVGTSMIEVKTEDGGLTETCLVTVVAPAATVTSVTVNPDSATVMKGNTKQFTAEVNGTLSQAVTWTIVETTKHASTTIVDGLLTVAEGETLSSLTVKATSTVDATKSGTATVTLTNPSATVNYLALTSYITKPATGAEPNPLQGGPILATEAQYSGVVTWSHSNTAHTGVLLDPENPGGFWGSTVYTATVTLTAKSGYTFTGVLANKFTHSDATSVTNPAGSGSTITVTIVFPITAVGSDNTGGGDGPF